MSYQARNIRTILLFTLLALTMLHAGFSTDSHAGSQPYLSGHGINFATGNKYLVETDIILGGSVQGMSFRRFYNSQSTDAGIMGYGWSCLLTERLIDNNTSITLVQQDGRRVDFASDGQGGYVAVLGSPQSIARVSGGFRLTQTNRDVHAYNSAGHLTGITFRNGTTLSYSYSGNQVNDLHQIAVGVVEVTLRCIARKQALADIALTVIALAQTPEERGLRVVDRCAGPAAFLVMTVLDGVAQAIGDGADPVYEPRE
jgi:hypothetical protein